MSPFHLSLQKRKKKSNYFGYFALEKNVEKSSQGNLNVIKNTLPSKSGNPESLKK